MIRSLYPIDLVELLVLSPRVAANEAITREGLVRAGLVSAGSLLEHWLPLRARRNTWLSLRRGRILGIVSARSCTSPTVWQIDYLQVSDRGECLSLLDRLSAFCAQRGARKLFLRLPSGSPLIEEARRASFSYYCTDYLYRYGGEGRRWAAEALGHYVLRPRSSADEYRLFELYSAAVPASVRIAEGMTLKEWQESRDRGSWLKRHREFVLERGGSLMGWLRIVSARGMGCFEILLHPEEREGLEGLLTCGLTYLDGKSPLYCIAPAFQGLLRRLLEELGFESVGEYSALVKDIAMRAEQPAFLPARV